MKTIVRHLRHRYIAWTFVDGAYLWTQYATEFHQLEIRGTLVQLYY